MKLKIVLVASLLAFLPALPALAQVPGQLVTSTKVPGSKASSPATGGASANGFRSHKPTDFCTTAPRGEWFDEEEMKLLAVHRGYHIKTFKVSKTNCYEVYGFDKNKRLVEAYFDPITTRLMLQNTVQ